MDEEEAERERCTEQRAREEEWKKPTNGRQSKMQRKEREIKRAKSNTKRMKSIYLCNLDGYN